MEFSWKQKRTYIKIFGMKINNRDYIEEYLNATEAFVGIHKLMKQSFYEVTRLNKNKE